MATNRQVAEAFVEGLAVKAENMYSTENAVYSYGPHFCIAKVIGGKFFFTMRGYRQTTAKHKNLVARAIRRVSKFYLIPDPGEEFEPNMAGYRARIMELGLKIPRARVNRDVLRSERDFLVKSMEEYRRAVGASDEYRTENDK